MIPRKTMIVNFLNWGN